MKTKLLLLLLFFTAVTSAQIINIPDANFKAKLLSANAKNGIAQNSAWESVVVDSNGDGEIQLSETLGITSINVENSKIESMDGIKSFAALEYLRCSSNLFKTLDVSEMINLTSLFCVTSNNLNYINANGCLKMEYLHAPGNKIELIDIKGLASLNTLGLNDNLLTTLDLSTCPNLTTLSVANNLLTTIDVTAQSKIITLWLSNNKLTSLYCKNGSNEFTGNTETTLSGNPSLSYICADDAELAAIVAMKLPNANITSFCDVAIPEYNTISGKLTVDDKVNGCDVLDIGQNLMKVTINDGTNYGATFTQIGGYYEFKTGAGAFNLKPVFDNNLFTASPELVVVTTPGINNSYNTANFCITPNGIHPDIEIVLIPIRTPRPGFNAIYKIVYKNKGNQILSGAITLTFEGNKLKFASSSLLPNATTANTLMWNYTNLVPYDSRTVDIDMLVNSPQQSSPINIGDVLNFNANATINNVIDENLNNNNVDFKQVVIGSFDPNNIICAQGEEQPVTAIGDYLHYVINFENIGTAAANFVVVTQDINMADFDIESLELLNTSHNVTANVKGNAVEFRFDGINLAAKATGNIIYKIKSLKTLKEGDSVMNKANIVFDFNEAIATNEAVTTYKTILGTDDFTVDKSVKIYPNPAKDVVKVETNNTIKNIQLYDVQGRILQTVTPNQNAAMIDISAKAAGIYFLKVTTAKGTKTEKLIKQ